MDGLRVSRKSWLEELLIGVFTVKHVKLLAEENGKLFPIVYEKGWFQYAKCTQKYFKNYAHLFKRALLDNDTVYYSDNYNKKEKIDRDHIIENAKTYFSSFGYSEWEYTVKYSHNDIGRLFYKIIIKEILPIIFESGQDIEADITDTYNEKKERLHCLFSTPDLDDLFYIDARNRDIDKILDYGLMEDESKADIAIPIDTSGLHLGLLMPWQKNAVEIVTKPADSDYKAWSERTDLSLDELMEKWIKYPYDPKAHFDKPWNPFLNAPVERLAQREYCPITHTEIKRFGVLSRYVFFVTNTRFFEKCSSYDEMKLVINERLKKTISDEYDINFYAYYKSISDEIREMVSILFSADMKLLIAHDKESYKEMVEHFNLDPDLLYKSCSFERTDEDEIIDAVYNILEKAIYDFATRIDNNASSLVKEFKKRMNTTHLINTIENYINDDSFIESIRILDDNLKEKRDKYYPVRKKATGSSLLDAFNTVFSPEENYLQYLKNALQKFYDCLKANVSDESQVQFNNKEESTVSDDASKKNTFKENIDQAIELLKAPILVYLKTQYTMLQYINGDDVQFTMSNYNDYDRLRTELLEYMYGLFPFYHHLLDIDKQLKELFDARTDINDDIYNSIIESNLCNYKRMLYSKYGISDAD